MEVFKFNQRIIFARKGRRSLDSDVSSISIDFCGMSLKILVDFFVFSIFFCITESKINNCPN